MRAMGGNAYGVCSADADGAVRIQQDRVRLGIDRGTAAPEPEGLTRSSVTLTRLDGGHKRIAQSVYEQPVVSYHAAAQCCLYYSCKPL